MTPHDRRVFGLITLTLTAISIGVAVILWFTGRPEDAAWFIGGAIILALNTTIEFIGAANEQRRQHANDQ